VAILPGRRQQTKAGPTQLSPLLKQSSPNFAHLGRAGSVLSINAPFAARDWINWI
jgi:hypothetical protein